MNLDRKSSMNFIEYCIPGSILWSHELRCHTFPKVANSEISVTHHVSGVGVNLWSKNYSSEYALIGVLALIDGAM